jgi:DNA-binding PadR family transcriptional regulator
MYTKEIPQLTKRLKPNKAYNELTPKMKVALRILESSDIENEDINFSKLVEDMETEVSRITIHEALDSLIDQGTVTSEWIKNKENRWIRGYRPASEGQRRLLRRAYYATHDDV